MVEVCSDVVMADIADVQMWDVEGYEVDRVRAGAWLRCRGECKSSVKKCGRRDFRMEGGLERQ